MHSVRELQLSQESGTSIPLLRFAFSLKVTLTFPQLQALADHLQLERKGCNSRAKMLDLLASWICRHDEPTAKAAYLANVHALEVAVKQFTVDPYTEAAFDELDGDEQKELGEVMKKISDIRRQRKVWSQESISMVCFSPGPNTHR